MALSALFHAIAALEIRKQHIQVIVNQKWRSQKPQKEPFTPHHQIQAPGQQ